MNRLLGCFLFANLVTMLTAQTPGPDSPVRPTEPILRRAPAGSSWTISYEYKSDGDDASTAAGAIPPATGRPSGGSLTQVVVEKVVDGYHEIRSFAGGPDTEFWLWHGTAFFAAGPDAPVIRVPTMSDAFSDYGPSDFEVLSWIGTDNFVGKVKFHGKPAFMFRVKRQDKPLSAREGMEDMVRKLVSVSPPNNGDEVVTAWIDATTQLPLGYEDSGRRLSYMFGTLSPATAPSDKFLAAFRLVAQQEAEKEKYPYAAP